ncbi:MAG TPA: FlgD immunoglobulin-like domain containing protein, partial [bacterium]|nr:FlgD immunoglobulin-like domain containing protein [bacterium]
MLKKCLYGCLVFIIFVALSGFAQVVCTPDRNTVSIKSGDIFVFTVSNPNPPQDISIKVYDANGKFVRTLFEKCTTETQFKIPWNLKDTDGKTVSPGKYTVKIQIGLNL